MPSKKTDQLQDVQRRVQLAKKLFTEQGEFIRSIVCFVADHNEYTDDLVQDLFLSFVAKPIPDDVVNIHGYLYKMILGKVTDLRRARIRYQSKIWKYGEINSTRSTALYPDVERHEYAQKMLYLIEKHLTKTEVMAIVLRYQNQYEIEDVARKMNVKPSSVSRYISVGLKKIRQLLNIQQGVDHEEGD